METGETIYEKVYASPRPPPKIFHQRQDEEIGFRSCWTSRKAPKQPSQRPQIELLEQVDLLRRNHRPVQVFRKSTNVSYLAARVHMCLLNVQITTKSIRKRDADRVGTERSVGSEQSDSFTQCCEKDINSWCLDSHMQL